jgi:hypothetical protein
MFESRESFTLPYSKKETDYIDLRRCISCNRLFATTEGEVDV